MKLSLCLLVLAFATVNCFYRVYGPLRPRPNPPPPPPKLLAWGKRSTDSPSDAPGNDAAKDDVKELFNTVHAMLAAAKKSMPIEDLVETATTIYQTAENIVDSRQDSVEDTAVQAVIDEIVSSYDGKLVASALFDGPLTFDASKFTATFNLMRDLLAKAEKEEGSGQSSTVTLAAMGKTAQAIVQVSNGVKEIVYKIYEGEKIAQDQDQNVEKRMPLMVPTFSPRPVRSDLPVSPIGKRSSEARMVKKRLINVSVSVTIG